MNWASGIEDFKHYLKLERSLSDNTILAYSRDLEKVKFWAEENDHHPLKMSYPLFSELLVYLHERGLSPRSRARLISSLKAFYKYLILEDYLDSDRTELLESPKMGRKLPDVLSREEIDLIIQSIDLSKEGGERNRSMLETLYGCGLRVSELINLKLSDLFLNDGLIRVIGKGNKERIVPINMQAIHFINIYKNEIRVFQKIKKGNDDILYLNRRGSKLTREMIFTIIKDLTVKTGIKKKVSPHTFRHSFASHLVNNGADIRIVQELLGHASILTTEIYTHLDKGKLREAIEKFHPRS